MDVQAQIAKYQRNATAPTALASYKDGIAGVKGSPTAKAAQKLDKFLASVTDAVQSGRMAAALLSVDEASWKDMTQQKAGNYQTGIKLGMPKYTKFATSFAPMQQQVTDRVNSMPDNTLEERIAKSAEQARGTAALKGKWRSRF